MPLKFWWNACVSFVFIINRLPTKVLASFQSPFQTLFGSKPDYSFFKVFGRSCYPYLRPYNSHKFSFKSTKCLFFVIALLIKGIDVLVLLVEFMLLSQSHSMKMTFLTLHCLLNPILHISLLSTSSVVHHICCLIVLQFLHLLLIYLLHLLNATFLILLICLILLLQLLLILQWLLPCLSLMLYLTMCALVFLIL